MKETIKYYYNVYPEDIYEIDNGCYFFLNDIKYYFVKFNRDVREIDILVKVSNELYNRNILVDTFIESKDKTFYVYFDDVIYVMLRVNSIEDDQYNLKDLVYFNNLLIANNAYRINTNWANLWMKKIDDFEMEIGELNTEYPILQDTFDYYVGLCENAITYVNDTFMEEDTSIVKVNLNHKRVSSSIYSGYVNNPLTFTFDYEVRDIAEYIKSKFFKGILDFDEVEDLIYENNFSRASYRLLFARLLYPSYYFDLVKKMLEGEVPESDILLYVNNASKYEDLLVDIYNLINKRANIPPVEWLFK